MNITEYAKSELERLGKDDEGMQELINKDILEIVERFASQGHSGFLASYALSVLERLLRFKPLTALTGEEEEWNDLEWGAWQNKRCSSVFKHEDGTVRDVDGIVVSDNGGITWFTGKDFQKLITFPYTPPVKPERVYIEYTEEVPPGFTSDKYDIITDQPERIKELYKRKRKEFDEAYQD